MDYRLGMNTPFLPVPPQHLQSPRNTPALELLADRARAELNLLNLPPANWVPPQRGPDGAPVLDVLVAGGGMCGQTVTMALLNEGIGNVRAIDKSPRGHEGPWGTFARMLTLRSPKHLTGPDLGLPSLTFRAWYEAQHGKGMHSHFAPQAPGWAGLHKIGRLDWRDYLLWVRDTAALPVSNDTALLDVTDAPDRPGLLQVQVQSQGHASLLYCRKLVLALGRDGSGAPRWPHYPSLTASQARAHARVLHSADAIDFEAMTSAWACRNATSGSQKPHLAVLGAGASAFDNAACALEAGMQVSLHCRRAHLPQVNKSKWTAFAGCLQGFAGLSDDQKWQIYTYIFAEQVPPPWETVRRCDDHADFSVHLGETWLDVNADDLGVTVTTPTGAHRYDGVIFGTGFDVDLLERPEIARYRDAIDTWANHVTPAQAQDHSEAARFPYLGPGFELRSKTGEHALALANIHLFNWGSTLSHGAVAGDIPGLAVGAKRLARALTDSLFKADAQTHWQALLSHREPELQQTRWYVP